MTSQFPELSCDENCCRGRVRAMPLRGRSAGLRPEPESTFRLGPVGRLPTIARENWQLGAFLVGVLGIAATNIAMGNW